MASMKYVGVDGCKGGWFSVGLDKNGYDFGVFREFGELLGHYKDAKLVLVDIPIGLPRERQRRECDTLARKKISPLNSSVFAPPTRKFAQKVKKGLKFRKGLGFTRQTHGISKKTAEVNGIMIENRYNACRRIREVHPELCFWALNGGESLKLKKKFLKGKAKRLELLQNVEPRAKEIFEKGCSTVCSSSEKDIDVAFDDILDALVAAVTAYKGSRLDQLQTLPEKPKKDSKKLPMEMVYWIPS